MNQTWIELDIESKTSCRFFHNRTHTQFLKISSDKTYLKYFEREFFYMQDLKEALDDSSFLPNYYQYGVTSSEKNPFIIMEYLKGETLTNVLASRRNTMLSEPRYLFSTDELQDICNQIYNALRLLAHNNILYFDLSPDNILISYENHRPRIKLIDFTSCYCIPLRENNLECHAINNHMDPEFTPPLSLLNAMMLFFVRLFFTCDDLYHQYLLDLSTGSINDKFFTTHFGTTLDLILAPYTFDREQILRHAHYHFHNANCNYLYYLDLWYKRLKKHL